MRWFVQRGAFEKALAACEDARRRPRAASRGVGPRRRRSRSPRRSRRSRRVGSQRGGSRRLGGMIPAAPRADPRGRALTRATRWRPRTSSASSAIRGFEEAAALCPPGAGSKLLGVGSSVRRWAPRAQLPSPRRPGAHGGYETILHVPGGRGPRAFPAVVRAWPSKLFSVRGESPPSRPTRKPIDVARARPGASAQKPARPPRPPRPRRDRRVPSPRPGILKEAPAELYLADGQRDRAWSCTEPGAERGGLRPRTSCFAARRRASAARCFAVRRGRDASGRRAAERRDTKAGFEVVEARLASGAERRGARRPRGAGRVPPGAVRRGPDGGAQGARRSEGPADDRVRPGGIWRVFERGGGEVRRREGARGDRWARPAFSSRARVSPRPTRVVARGSRGARPGPRGRPRRWHRKGRSSPSSRPRRGGGDVGRGRRARRRGKGIGPADVGVGSRRRRGALDRAGSCAACPRGARGRLGPRLAGSSAAAPRGASRKTFEAGDGGDRGGGKRRRRAAGGRSGPTPWRWRTEKREKWETRGRATAAGGAAAT